MRRTLPLFALTLGLLAGAAHAQAPASGPYKVLKTAKVGGEGGFDYVTADSAARRLYIARSGPTTARISVYDLDTLALVGELPGFNGHGVVVDPKSGNAFATSKPLAMFDAKTLTAKPPIAVSNESPKVGAVTLCRAAIFSAASYSAASSIASPAAVLFPARQR